MKNTVSKVHAGWAVKCWSGGTYLFKSVPTAQQLESPYMAGECLSLLDVSRMELETPMMKSCKKPTP